MKKLFAAAASLLFILPALNVPASADAPELPFDLTAPENVTLTYLNGRDAPNTCEIHYSQNNSMSAWSSRKESDYDAVMEEMNELGFDDIWITAQIDWSIDSQSDWHCNEYWETEGYDEDYHQHLGEWAYISETYSPEISMDTWIFRYMGNPDDPEDTRWYGRHADGDDYSGWKDVLREDQYDIVSSDQDTQAKIDFTKHTVYARVRWLVTYHMLEADENETCVSDWSAAAAAGGETPTYDGPIQPGDVAPPIIKDLRYTDEEFNGFPVIAFKLEVDEVLAQQLTQASGTLGSISLETEACVQGSDEWIGLQGDWTVKTGEMKIDLLGLAESAGGKIEKDTPIMLRARYRCSQEDQEDFYSGYSKTIAFGSVEMEAEEQVYDGVDAGDAAVPTIGAVEEPAAEESHFWRWLLLIPILLLVIVIILFVIYVKKTQKKQG